MSIKKSLNLLEQLAKEHNLSKPYVVGGVPRNSFMGEPYELADIDITTGNEDVYPLAHLFASSLGKPVHGSSDHLFVYDDDVKYDFSINFKYPEIDNILKEMGIDNPNDMQREAFSRDFTINTLMFTPSFDKQIDITGTAIKDLDNKLLRCPVSCDIALSQDPKRILRAFYFKAKYDMTFDQELEEAIRNNAHMVAEINRRYASEIINKCLRENEYIIDDFIALGVIQHLPMTHFLKEKLLKQNKMMYALSSFNYIKRVATYIRKNLDYADDSRTIVPFELDSYCDEEENVEYWKGEDEDSEAKKDFISYITEMRCK